MDVLVPGSAVFVVVTCPHCKAELRVYEGDVFQTTPPGFYSQMPTYRCCSCGKTSIIPQTIDHRLHHCRAGEMFRPPQDPTSG